MADVKDITPDLDRLDSQLDDLEDALEPLLGNLEGLSSQLPLLDKAKLFSLTAYAIESLLFCKFHPAGMPRTLSDLSSIFEAGGGGRPEPRSLRRTQASSAVLCQDQGCRGAGRARDSDSDGESGSGGAYPQGGSGTFYEFMGGMGN